MISGNGKLPWKNVSRDRPCPKCGKPDWCRVDERGDWACCKRTPEGAHKEKKDRNGEAYWVHRLTPWPEREPRAPAPKYSVADGRGKCADADSRAVRILTPLRLG